jgi:hypothetical protein
MGRKLLLESDRAVVVCAGAPCTMTLWYWNLIANPTPALKSETKRDAKYAEQAQRYPQYAEYQRTTTRTIAVEALMPKPASS